MKEIGKELDFWEVSSVYTIRELLKTKMVITPQKPLVF
jgi:hypothetical protein